MVGVRGFVESMQRPLAGTRSSAKAQAVLRIGRICKGLLRSATSRCILRASTTENHHASSRQKPRDRGCRRLEPLRLCEPVCLRPEPGSGAPKCAHVIDRRADSARVRRRIANATTPRKRRFRNARQFSHQSRSKVRRFDQFLHGNGGHSARKKIRLHHHPHAEEILFVHRGTGVVRLGSREATVRAVRRSTFPET